MILWNEEYSTGNPTIDKQHRLLFQFVNDMEEVYQEGHAESWLMTGFNFLKSYAQAHFGYEEDCMLRSHCSVAEQNHKAHGAFLEKITKAELALIEKGYSPQAFEELHRYLESWITGHIMALDRRLKENSS